MMQLVGHAMARNGNGMVVVLEPEVDTIVMTPLGARKKANAGMDYVIHHPSGMFVCPKSAFNQLYEMREEGKKEC